MTTLEEDGTPGAAADADPNGVLALFGHPQGRRQRAAVASMLAFGLGLGRSYPSVGSPVDEQRRQLSTSIEPVAGVLARRLVTRGRVAGWALVGLAVALAGVLIGVAVSGAPSAPGVLTASSAVAVALVLIGWAVLRRISAAATCERDRLARWLAGIAIVTAAGEILARRARDADEPAADE